LGQTNNKEDTVRRYGKAVTIAAVVVLGCAVHVGAVSTNDLRTVSVTGTAVGYVPIDTVLWTITLEVRDKDFIKAKDLSEQQVRDLVLLLKQTGVQAADINTGLPRIKDDAESRLTTATRDVTARQRDSAGFTKTLEALTLDRRLKFRYGITSSRRPEVEKDTLLKAVQAAKDKAQAMAVVAGARLGHVLTINEYPPPGWKVSTGTVPVDAPTSAFGAEAETVAITVYVTFELE
jgi:uncharacterized protein YggE